MTRQEHSGTRDLFFSGWIRSNLPDSYSGFRVTDLDFILANVETKQIMLIEVKQHGAEVRPWQRSVFNLIHHALTNGIDVEWTYHGFHRVRFIGYDFTDGRVFLDKDETTENALRTFLSMEQHA